MHFNGKLTSLHEVCIFNGKSVIVSVNLSLLSDAQGFLGFFSLTLIYCSCHLKQKVCIYQDGSVLQCCAGTSFLSLIRNITLANP